MSLITVGCTCMSHRNTSSHCDPRSSPRGSPTTPPLASRRGQPPRCLNKQQTLLNIKYGHCRDKKVLATANRSRVSIRLGQTALSTYRVVYGSHNFTSPTRLHPEISGRTPEIGERWDRAVVAPKTSKENARNWGRWGSAPLRQGCSCPLKTV